MVSCVRTTLTAAEYLQERRMNPYQSKALQIVKEMAPKIKEIDTDWGWGEVSTDDQIGILDNLIRLHGIDSWSSTEICQTINGMSGK